MAKAKLTWAPGENPISSQKQNQQTIDHITPGMLIWSISFDIVLTTPTSQIVTNVRHAWYPYHGDKSVFDRLYLLGREIMDGAETTDELEISLDGGSNWTQAFPSAAAAPVDFYASAGTLVEIHDISVISGFQWIGIRRGTGLPASYTDSYRLKLTGILYRSTDTPF